GRLPDGAAQSRSIGGCARLTTAMLLSDGRPRGSRQRVRAVGWPAWTSLDKNGVCGGAPSASRRTSVLARDDGTAAAEAGGVSGCDEGGTMGYLVAALPALLLGHVAGPATLKRTSRSGPVYATTHRCLRSHDRCPSVW